LSSGSVPGSTIGNVVHRNVDHNADSPVSRTKKASDLEEWVFFGVAALLSSPGQQAANGAFRALSSLTLRFLQHHFRLTALERKLSARLRARRRGSAWKATRQIELERQRLGRELHTGVGQMLAAVRLQLELVAAHVADPSPTVRQALERASILLRDALEEVRSVSKRLHPPDWQRLTLEAALRLLWEMSGVPESYHTTFHIDPLPAEPDLDRKILVYRCLQEALSNVTRHSRAKSVSVSLRAGESRLILTVSDDGVGFDATRILGGPLSAASGIGLHAVREHAAALGGKLDIESGPLGTKLELSVPVRNTQS